MKKQIQQLLEQVLEEMGLEQAVSPQVTVPENPEHGDYSTNVAMVLFPKLPKPPKFPNPHSFAEELKNIIQKHQKISDAGIIDRVEVAGPGFLNLYVSEASLGKQVQEVLKMQDAYGRVPKIEKIESKGLRVQGLEAKKTSRKMAKNMESQLGEDKQSPNTQNAPIFSRKNSASESLARQNNKKQVGESSKLIPESSKNGQSPERAIASRRVMIEFADPNPFKEIHIGHVRNISLGESFCRLLESQGNTVRRANYEGDVGLHVAKSLWGLERLTRDGVDTSGLGLDVHAKAALLGRAYAVGSKTFESEDSAKADMVLLNKKIYAMDEGIVAAWRRGREWSLSYFDTVYARLGTHFDRYYFESEVAPVGLALVEKHLDDHIFEKSEGAIVYRGEKAGLHTRVFVTKDHYATYEAKDLGLAPLKYGEWPYDLSIIMTGNEQSEYFKVMLAALAQINPDLAAKTRHISFGMVRLTTGKMSSRTGDVITADWLIEQAKKRIGEILARNVSNYTVKQQNDIAEKAAIAAIKYSMLRVNASSDIAFDLEASVSFEGDSGPYLQYTYARCRSVIRRASISTLSDLGDLSKSQEKMNPEERMLARSLIQFPDVVAEAAENFAPNTICTYLFHLAQEFNLFYAKHHILAEGENMGVPYHASKSKKNDEKQLVTHDTLTHDTVNFRLTLTAATAQVIKNGLYLLGIETLEQM